MKTKVRNSVKIGLIIVGAFLVSSFARAAGTFTAVTSGNWSSSITWGGTPPPFNLSIGDQVTINSGVTVTMDSTVTLNGLLSQVTVSGALSSASTMSLNVVTGTLAGTGTINVGNVVLDAGGTFTFSGALTAQNLTNSIVSLTSTAVITINKTLTLMSALIVQTGGSLTMSANTNIIVLGGQLNIGGGTLNLGATYDVTYVSTSTTAGLELSGSGLRNVTVNVGMGNSVSLSTNFTSNDSLKFTIGSLTLSGNTLTINGKVSGTALLTGDANADLNLTTSGGIAVPVTFTSGGQLLNNLTVNIGSGNSLILASNLTIDGNLTLSGGSNLNIGGQSVIFYGTIAGSGMLVVNSTSSVAFDTTGSITNPIMLSGTSIGNFTVNVGTGNAVILGSNLNVAGTLSLKSGSLVLNSKNITVTGDIAASGSGNLSSTANSDVTINTATSPSGTLAFYGAGNVVNHFNINIGGAGSLVMASDVVIQTALAFTAGHLNTGSYNVQIASGGSITGTNSNAYVITAANGNLTMNVTTASSAVYPVGTISAYFPASITLNSGSSTGTIGVNVSSGVYSSGTSGVDLSSNQPLVNATWLFETSISSGLNYNMQLMWSPAAEVNGFVHTNDYISHYTSGAWDTYAFANATASGSGMFSIQRNNLTSMSPFAVFDSSTAPSGINELVNNSLLQIYPNPTSEFLNVKNVWTGNGQVFADIVNICGQVISTTELNNSSITSIPVKGLTNGVYFVRLYNDKIDVVQKFIKVD